MSFQGPSREVLWEALPRGSMASLSLRSVASEPNLVATQPLQPVPAPAAPVGELWANLRSLQRQQRQQVEALERVQREAQDSQLKLLQVTTRMDQLELSSHNLPGFMQRDLENRLMQEREMQHALQSQGASWSIQAAQQGLARLEATVQALAARFEAKVQSMEMGSDVKVVEGILQAEPLPAEQLTAALESRLTEIHLTLNEHSSALERLAAVQQRLEDSMAGLRLSCAQEFSALDGQQVQQLEGRMQRLENNFREAGSSQKLPWFEGQLQNLQQRAAEESKRCDNVLLELQTLRQSTQDLQVAQMHHDTAMELQSKRLDERLDRLEEDWKTRKQQNGWDNSEELKALWRNVSGLTGRLETIEALPRPKDQRLLSGASQRAAALSAVEVMEAATQRLMACRP